MALVERADQLGYRRYWFAEHHNMPAVASTTPPVLIAAATGRTKQIRLGSGGVMLPNHAPMIAAEQFAALEAIAPGRIDLGIGRAPGSDPVVTQLLRRGGTTSDVEKFPEHIREILGMVSPEGLSFRFVNGGEYQVHATPAAASTPDVWLLGSSDYSAQLAASLGLPYVFANHFAGQGLQRAMDLYRTQFQATEENPTPRTFVTANVIVADTAEEAEARALPQLRMFSRLRTGKPLTALDTVEQAIAANTAENDAMAESFKAQARQGWFVGTRDDVRASLAEFATKNGVDEIMVVPVAGSYDAEAADTTPGRMRTLELLSD